MRSSPNLAATRLAIALSGLGLALSASAQGAPAPPSAASAPAASASAVADIVVTAEKRDSPLQRTPAAITATRGADLEARGISSTVDLARETPGVAVKGGGPGQTEVAIRGLSATAGVSPTVGFYVDETPVSPPALTGLGKVDIDPDLYDLSRVEILRGPQGVLYGAGSMGGTIKLVANAPDLAKLAGDVRLRGSATQGGGANGAVDAMINIPLATDAAALRVVVTDKHLSGWIDRVVIADFPLPEPGRTGYFEAPRGDVLAATPTTIHRHANTEDLQGVRASLLLKPTASLSITPSIFTQDIRQAAPDTYDAQPGTPAHYQPFDIAEPYRDRFGIASLKVDWALPDVSITSATAAIRRDRRTVQDASEISFKALADAFGLTSYGGTGGFGASALTEKEATTQLTQEVRLSSTASGPWRWLVGAFYSRLRSGYDAVEIEPGAAAIVGTTNFYDANLKDTLRQSALFGNASVDLGSRLRLTGGLRYFRSDDQAQDAQSGLFSSNVSEDTGAKATGFAPMANLAWTIDPGAMLYANAAKGFRDGAAQDGAPATCGADLAARGLSETPRRYAPDSVWSYELGSKNRFLDGLFTVDAGLYHMDWSHVQQYVALPTCGFTYIANAASAAVNGIELEAVATTSVGISVEQSVALSRARFTSGNAETGTQSGDRLLNVPDWTATTALRYACPINDRYGLTTRVDATYVGSQQALTAQRTTLPGYVLMGLRSSLQAQDWSATFFVDNLANRQVALDNVPSLTINAPGLDRVQANRPRTVGVEVDKQF